MKHSNAKLTISEFREEMGWTLEKFGRAIGILSKGRMSEIQSGKVQPRVNQALEIERLSGGRINASDLNDEVRAARAVILDGFDHDVMNSSGQSDKSMGQKGQLSRDKAALGSCIV